MNTPAPQPPAPPQAITHYENFPVASWLCPPHLRAPIAAIYAFARTADDLADEGNASPTERLHDLAIYRADLHATATGNAASARWPEVFAPLAHVLRSHHLPVPLLDYCRRSANPVGRLLLHLYGVHSAQALRESDAICTALQLINFWQDLSVDIPRGRFYLPDDDCAAHGVDCSQLQALQPTPRTTALITEHARWARATMLEGAPLVHRLPGRIGWELRLVVQGGLRILDKVDALHGHSLCQRPRIRAWDAPAMLGRALVM